MASQIPGFATSFTDLAMALLSSSEVVPRARLIAQQVAELVPDSGVVVYVVDRSGEPVWTPKATAGEVAFEEPRIPLEAGTLGALYEKQAPVLFSGARLPREQYSHLHVRRTLVSLAGLPVMAGDELVGAIEVITFDTPLQESRLASLVDLTRLCGLGLAAGLAYESERNTSLESITRLTALYDLERSFNSTLEMDDLLPLIASKYHELLKVQAVNIWLVEGEALRLMNRAGVDPTMELDAVQAVGQGLTGDLADIGEPVIVHADADERLQKRNSGCEERAIFSLMAAPLLHGGAEVGWVECVNKLDGTPFDEDDLFFLTTVNVTASSALHNASLLLAERKVEIMETLVRVSQEITSTLSLDRVMQAIVNTPQAVIPYERAAILLEQHGKPRLSAVSGQTEINRGDPEIRRLDEMLRWASLFPDSLYVREKDGHVEAAREESRLKFEEYFRESGMRAWYSLPLADDTGRLGVLSLESSDFDFLTDAHMEMIKILGGQATVALRNAAMYREVPFIGILEPVLERKRQFLALEKRRRGALMAATAIVLLFLIFCPIPMRISGEATVAPAFRAQVQPEIEGVVQKVYAREGAKVKAGAILADLADWDYRAALAAAEAKYNTAVAQMNRALASNDGTEAGMQRAQVEYWGAERQRARERLERTHLRTPIDGVVSTPYVENLVGKHLEPGDSFAEVVDVSRAMVDISIPGSEVPLLRSGERASLKLDGFPNRTFAGLVRVVSPKSGVEGEERVFFARAEVPNAGEEMRSGMQGRGKVSVGWHAAGYVLFRSPAMWLYSKFWSWFGW
ncbi:MAG: efflux RND transporter periplasmic adaptor subunit [Terriglobales bacterium]